MANQHTKAKSTSAYPRLSACDVKAKTQPHFTLLAKDNFTPFLIREWIEMAINKGTPKEKIEEAREILAGIEEWRRLNPLECKTPD